MFDLAFENLTEDIAQPFLVDFDSLLLDLISNEQLDWSHGGQLVHLVFLMEGFLRKLLADDRMFTIIAFKPMQSIWISNTAALARALLLEHLSQTNLTVLIFDNWWCSEWHDYIESLFPSFVLIGDGMPSNEGLISTESFNLFEKCTLAMLATNLRCVRTTEVSFVQKRMFGFVIVKPNDIKNNCWIVESPEEQKEEIVDQGPFALPDVPPHICMVAAVCKELIDSFPGHLFNSETLCKAFLLHSFLLLHIPISRRSFVLTPKEDAAKDDVIKFLDAFSNISLKKLASFTSPNFLFCDLFDGRFLAKLLHLIASSDNIISNDQLGLSSKASTQLVQLWSLVSSSTFFPLVSSPTKFKDFVGAIPDGKTQVSERPFISLSRFQGDGVIANAMKEVDSMLEERKLVRDPPESPGPVPSVWEPDALFPFRFPPHKHDRFQQKIISFMEHYIKGLAGGKIVLRDVLIASIDTAGGVDEEKKISDDRSGKGKKGGRGKVKQVKGKDKIKEGVLLRKKQNAIDDMVCKVRLASAQRTLEARIELLDRSLLDISDYDIAMKPMLKLLEWCEKAWVQNVMKLTEGGEKMEYTPLKMQTAVRLFQIIHDIFRRFSTFLSIDELRRIQQSLLLMGFEEHAKLLSIKYQRIHSLSNKEKKKLSSTLDNHPLASDNEDYDFEIPVSIARFQLAFAGPFMLRDVQSAPDDRVSGFYPDAWQRKLLDAVDNDKSALIVAPTSSGKTFIAYYAMKKVIQDNKSKSFIKDKGVVVYVSPSKAVSNQVTSEIYKSYGDVFGNYVEAEDPSAEYSRNRRVLDSDVLVILPSYFENLLLEPSCQDWVKRIRYVIFDEVHCIDRVEEGAHWERLLYMIQAPFLALSATVGNPEEFHSWLARLQQFHNRDVEIIIHDSRWSDLQKYMYLPSVNVTGFRTVQSKVPEAILPIHPATAIFESPDCDSFPKSLPFSPSDCLVLYERMCSVELPPEFATELSKLRPEVFFGYRYIAKSDASKYEAALKEQLVAWKTSGLVDTYNKCMENIAEPLRKRIELALKNATAALKIRTSPLYAFTSKEFIKNNFLTLLVEMNNLDWLPCIAFSFEREFCEELVLHILNQLEEMERVAKASEQPSNERQRERAKQRAAKQAKRSRDKQEKKDKNTVDSEDEPPEDVDNIIAESSEYEVDPRFSFVLPNQRLHSEDIDYWMNRLVQKTHWNRTTHFLIRALKRGIGIHHPAMPRRYRDIVETLFRLKHIRVVLSSESLALGVHMPARSVIFCGDHNSLTPLQYRQMSGRSGRRGYDHVGHVVFFSIHPAKVYRLMTSDLSSLSGSFPINATAVSRISQMAQHSNNPSAISLAIKAMLEEPFLKVKYPTMSTELSLNFRYTLDFLYRRNFLDSSANGYRFSGLVNFLADSEPSNFIFSSLVDMGVFETIVKKSGGKDKQAALSILEFLARILFLVPCPATATSSTLPAFGATLGGVVKQYNKVALAVFSDYIRVLSSILVDSASSSVLPLSKISFAGEPVSDNTLASLIACQSIIGARSPFVKLSGHTDVFHSPQDLAVSVAEPLQFQECGVPSLDSRDIRGRPLLNNSYVVDFYKSGKIDLVMSRNGFSSKTLYELLKKWDMFLGLLKYAFKNMHENLCEVEGKEALHKQNIRQKVCDCIKLLSDNMHEQIAKALNAFTA